MLETHLIVRMGRAMRDALVQRVLAQHSLADELVQLVFTGTQVQRMKGAWVLSGLHDARETLVEPHYQQILNHLRTELVGGVKRELLKCFLNPNRLNDDDKERLIALTMEWVTDHQQDLAVRYVCFKILKKQLSTLPELRAELDYIISLYREKYGRFP